MRKLSKMGQTEKKESKNKKRTPSEPWNYFSHLAYLKLESSAERRETSEKVLKKQGPNISKFDETVNSQIQETQ